MKRITDGFKEALKNIKQTSTIITYLDENQEVVQLDNETIQNTGIYWNTDLLKSCCKMLDLETSSPIPKGTELNISVGLLVGDNYEYVDYGKFYTTQESEYKLDTNTYLTTAYDAIVKFNIKASENPLSMSPAAVYTLEEYLQMICEKCGVTYNFDFTNNANANIQVIAGDPYVNNKDYTYRDILDDIAECLATNFIIDSNNRITNKEIKRTYTQSDIDRIYDIIFEIIEPTEEDYIKYDLNKDGTIDTTDEAIVYDIMTGAIPPYISEITIDADVLGNTNVNVGEKKEPITGVQVYGGSTMLNYIGTDTSVFKIKDNNILMAKSVELLPYILSSIEGLSIYTYSLNTYGVFALECFDFFTITYKEQDYLLYSLHNDIKLGNSLEETIVYEFKDDTDSQYMTSSNKDRINDAYIEIDKQNATITSTVNQVTEQNNKIAQITQTVDEINAKISDIADITVSGESNYATFTLENVNESEPIQIRVKPIDTSISYLYPVSSLYPSSSTYLKVRTVRFHNNTTNTDVDYILPDDLLIYDADHFDEFYLDYDSQTCQVTKRCKYNADGSVGLLASEQIVDYPYPEILLEDGDYTLTLLGYEYGYLFVRLMAKNIYTSQFYTKVETDSRINQKAGEIELGVSQTLTNYSTTAQMNSAINVKANEISSVVATKVGNNEVISKINQSAEAITINANKISLAGKTINLTSDNTQITSDNFAVNTNGSAIINSDDTNPALKITSKVQNNKYTDLTGRYLRLFNSSTGVAQIQLDNSTNMGIIRTTDSTGSSTSVMNGYYVESPEFRNTSIEELKKNIEPFENALNIINKTDIYKYNYKNEDDKEKKHIGLVIGKNYKYSKDITSKDNKGANLYSMVAVCFKAIQEQQKEIEELKKEINSLKGGMQ